MDPLSAGVLIYLISKAFSGGSDNVKKSHETNKKKLSPAKDGDKARKGTNVAAGLLTAGAAAYTFASGFKHGWKEAWPEAREVVAAQREKNKAAKDGSSLPPGDGRTPLGKADSAGVVGPPGLIPPPPSYPPDSSGPAPAGPASPATPGSSMTTPGTIEVRSVDTLVIWLGDTLEFANRETEDANAAVKRIRDLEAKVENAYNAAAAAKYDKETLGKLAGLREQLAALRTARQDDARNSSDAAGNSQISGTNVLTRHGGINEAAAASPVEMAESDTYVG